MLVHIEYSPTALPPNAVFNYRSVLCHQWTRQPLHGQVVGDLELSAELLTIAS